MLFQEKQKVTDLTLLTVNLTALLLNKNYLWMHASAQWEQKTPNQYSSEVRR